MPSSPPSVSAHVKPSRAWLSVGLGVLFVGVVLFELTSALLSTLRTPSWRHYQQAGALLRQSFVAGDLITSAPPFIDPLVREQVGDLMPIAMLGRPDAQRYPHLLEIALGAHQAKDTVGLTPDWQRRIGPLRVSRYSQRSLTVTYDLVEHFHDLALSQRLVTAGSDALPTPCRWQGQPERACPSDLYLPVGAYHCASGRIERRTLELAYAPRYGIAVELDADRETALRWENIPQSAWEGAQLHLWLALHDYYARKNARGPAVVQVDLDGGLLRKEVTLTPAEGEKRVEHLVLALPPAATDRPLHTIAISARADSAPHHIVGLQGALRR